MPEAEIDKIGIKNYSVQDQSGSARRFSATDNSPRDLCNGLLPYHSRGLQGLSKTREKFAGRL